MTYLIQSKKTGLYWNAKATTFGGKDGATAYDSPPIILRAHERLVKKELVNVEA